MYTLIAIAGYILIGLLFVWFVERRSKSISDVGGYKTAALIALIWPVFIVIHALMYWLPPATDVGLRILKYVRLPFIQLFRNNRPPKS